MNILFLDDDPDRHNRFMGLLEELGLDHEVTQLFAADSVTPENMKGQEIVFLDHDLCLNFYGDCPFRGGWYSGGGSECFCPDGRYLVRKIIQLWEVPRSVRMVVHSANPECGDAMAKRLIEAGFETLRYDWYDWWEEFGGHYEGLWRVLQTDTGFRSLEG